MKAEANTATGMTPVSGQRFYRVIPQERANVAHPLSSRRSAAEGGASVGIYSALKPNPQHPIDAAASLLDYTLLPMHDYYVYVLASRSRVLYTGVTRDLRKRIWHHKNGSRSGFTGRYRVSNLVYFETTTNVYSAIVREKQLKRWPRWRKIRLIEAGNPEWRDLSLDWFGGSPGRGVSEVQ